MMKFSAFLTVLASLLLATVFSVGPLNSQRANAQQAKQPAVVKIDPSKLLVRLKSARNAPDYFSDPRGWVQNKQRYFYEKMSGALQKIRRDGNINAALLLMFMSFVYGVLHAAGPGHGKAVVSAWMLANEQQLRRGIIIASMAAFVQAITAIVLVSAVLALVLAAGTKARFIASSLEAASFALIGLVGVYLIWQALKSKWPAASHQHDHHHDDDCATHQLSAASCDCGHAHMPLASDVTDDWSWTKAISLAIAVGIRPCSGAILVLLLSSTIGLYWAGIASTFAMAIGTGITVSVVAALAVTSKNLAVKITGGDSQTLVHIMFGVKLLAGLFIATTGGFLFWAALPRLAG